MVGVNVSTATRSAPSSDQLSTSSTYFVVGQTERGPINKALKVNSLSDYERLYGGGPAQGITYSAVHDDIQTHFEEGGVSAYVARTVGSSSTVSSLTLVDKAGSPVSTLRIDAYGPGAWGTGVTVTSAAGTTSGTYKLTIAYSGTGTQSPEVYDNLVTPADAVRQLANSAYVRAVDLGSATAAPNNQPAVSGPTALSGGTDDRGSITSSSYTTALSLFGANLGSGAVAIPGQAASAVGVGLAAHAVANNRIALTATAIAQTLNQAISAESSLFSSLSAGGTEYVGLFWPWIKIPDGSGGTRTISPEGFVAAKRAEAHETTGPAQPPAASFGLAKFAVDTETAITSANVDSLNGAHVSPITVSNGAVQLYGWRSLSIDTANYALLSQRDVINTIAVDIDALMEEFVYRIIDGSGRLFSEMEGKAIGYLDGLRVADQLFEKVDASGNQIDPGYRVDTGPSVNTQYTIQQNIANLAVNVRPPGAAELIQVLIAKVPVTGSV